MSFSKQYPFARRSVREQKLAASIRTSQNQKPILDISAALLWPAFSAGSFIFGMNKIDAIGPNDVPYKSEFKA